jgi:c-di-GMP-binding flagellar brake protein YcgR
MIDSDRPGERRDSDRLDLRLACLLQEFNHRGTVLKLYTKDISCRGAFFYLGHPLPVDTHVEMDLLVPAMDSNQRLINAHGKVIRANRKGIAVRFDSKIPLSKAS